MTSASPDIHELVDHAQTLLSVTRTAADKMAQVFNQLIKRQENPDRAQRFMLQCVIVLFAEGIGLLPKDLFIELLTDCQQKKGSVDDLIGGLFRQIGSDITMQGLRQRPTTNRYNQVPYFNTKIFSSVEAIELTFVEIDLLLEAAKENWSKVELAIFGTLFESSMGKEERHALGAHYTSEADIQKVILPTIICPWRERIEAAKTLRDLLTLQQEMTEFKVLDPACGSGNFLYVAYREMKRLEIELIIKIQRNFSVGVASRLWQPQRKRLWQPQRKRSRNRTTGNLGKISLIKTTQFYGIDIKPFAVELAKVTLMLAKKLAIDEGEKLFYRTQTNLLIELDKPLPLDNLDANIRCQDALFSEWEPVNAIIGNPPFLGGYRQRLELGNEYVDRLSAKFPEIKGHVDICTYWFRLAHDQLKENHRAGLIATNSISQGQSRRAALDYIMQNKGYIYDAIPTQCWSGAAKVHISIINWLKTSNPQKLAYRLDYQPVSNINSSLKAEIDVTQAVKLKANFNSCFRGVEPNGAGFIITEAEANNWIKGDRKNQEILKPFSMGANLAQNPHGQPERWIIDFNNMNLEEASKHILPLERLHSTIPQERKNRQDKLKIHWWKYSTKSIAVRQILATSSYCFAVPRVSKWSIFIPFPSSWLPGDKSIIIATQDFYILGILTSHIHRIWMYAQSSTLKADIAYTPTTCLETFPFPQNCPAKTKIDIRAAMQSLHEFRTACMEENQCGITQLYNQFFHEPTSQLANLHAKLDQLVTQAYDLIPQTNLLKFLLELNSKIALREAQGLPVIGIN